MTRPRFYEQIDPLEMRGLYSLSGQEESVRASMNEILIGVRFHDALYSRDRQRRHEEIMQSVVQLHEGIAFI